MRIIRTFFLLSIVAAGALGAAFATGTLQAPSFHGVENEFGTVTQNTTTINTNVKLHNPNPISFSTSAATVTYTASLNGIEMASGTKDNFTFTSGNTTIALTTQLDNTKIPDWWLTHIENGEQSTVAINASANAFGQTLPYNHSQSISTNVLGNFNSTEPRPVNMNHPLVDDPVLYINETSAQWDDPTGNETPIDAQAKVYNPKTVPYVITRIDYEVTMNNHTVGQGTTEQKYVIPPHSTETIHATPSIRADTLDEWWVSHLQNNQVSTMEIKFWAVIELPSGQTERVPLHGMNHNQTFKTDFFNNYPHR